MLALVLLAACTGDGPGTARRAATGDGIAAVTGVTEIGQLTGQPSHNDTGAVNVYGTDLGSMFVHDDGAVYFLFGDTFGPPGPPASSGDWRSNVMAFSTDLVAADGIDFTGWISDGGGARALIEGDHHANDGTGEVTKIPTCGYSYGGRQYLWFMSVSQWLEAGHWTVQFAELAYSDDDGETFTRSGLQRGPSSNFIQLAVAEHQGLLYLWGIPAGRFGGVALARVPPDALLESSAYEYYDGAGWSTSEAAAATIVPAPVGELSVLHDEFLDRWIMTYLDEGQARLEVREAVAPWGPWSEPWSLVTGADYPGLYGAFLHPRFTDGQGESVYFLMSQWAPYNVFLMRATFARHELGDDGGGGGSDSGPGADGGSGDDPGGGCGCRAARPATRPVVPLLGLVLALVLAGFRTRGRSASSPTTTE